MIVKYDTSRIDICMPQQCKADIKKTTGSLTHTEIGK